MSSLDEIIARRKKALRARLVRADDAKRDPEVRRLRKLLKRSQRRKLKEERRRRLAERKAPAAG